MPMRNGPVSNGPMRNGPSSLAKAHSQESTESPTFASMARKNTSESDPPSGYVEDMRTEANDHHSDQNVKICPFFLQGTCRYGIQCKLAHRFYTSRCPMCNKEVGLQPKIQQIHLHQCPENNAVHVERASSQGERCSICWERPLSNGRRFGLLTGCDHIFCLNCIRQWRGTLGPSREALRGCPTCRKNSFFVIPCDRVVIDETRKKKVVEAYKERLKEIPCKFYTDTEECPFGTSCFYKHVNNDGSVVDNENVRHRMNSDGRMEVTKAVKLSDFLFPDG